LVVWPLFYGSKGNVQFALTINDIP